MGGNVKGIRNLQCWAPRSRSNWLFSVLAPPNLMKICLHLCEKSWLQTARQTDGGHLWQLLLALGGQVSVQNCFHTVERSLHIQVIKQWNTGCQQASVLLQWAAVTGPGSGVRCWYSGLWWTCCLLGRRRWGIRQGSRRSKVHGQETRLTVVACLAS